MDDLGFHNAGEVVEDVRITFATLCLAPPTSAIGHLPREGLVAAIEARLEARLSREELAMAIRVDVIRNRLWTGSSIAGAIAIEAGEQLPGSGFSERLDREIPGASTLAGRSVDPHEIVLADIDGGMLVVAVGSTYPPLAVPKRRRCPPGNDMI
jgi:hypothetical protein